MQNDPIINLSDLLAKKLSAFSPQGISVVKTYTPPVYVCADPIEVNNVVEELLERAVSYKPRNIWVSLEYPNNAKLVRVLIQHNGYDPRGGKTPLTAIQGRIYPFGGEVGEDKRNEKGPRLWFHLPRMA